MKIKFKEGSDTYTYENVDLVNEFKFGDNEYITVLVSGYEVDICNDNIIEMI